VALRDWLDDLLFPPSLQRMQVKALSGGEKNRLLLARLFLEGANVLVLDEPTNDLDLVTLNVLERLLLDFGGSVLLVTHDRFFLDKVATAILAFEGDGTAVRWPGNYESYKVLKEQAEAARAEAARPRAATAARPASGGPASPPRPRRFGFKAQRELEGMEPAILGAEARKRALEAALADPATYQREGGAVAGMREELEAVTAEVERLYARWAELEALRGGG
jgi:ATP-binding cassette subfamily F protein uup